jgi:hypothetical protein
LNKYRFISISCAILFFAFPAFAQKDTVINGKRYQLLDPKKPVKVSGKRMIPLDSEFVMDNKRFRYYNNWVNVGIGAQQNLTYGIGLGFAGSADFNFHIKRNYFQIGGQLTGLHLGSYNNYQIHLGYGKRFEDKDVHFAGFAGFSYSSGMGRDSDSTYNRPYSKPGLYIEGEIVKKISYDIGFGGSLFADWNKEQSMIGARFIVYFSGSFSGKKYLN